jgi:tetratricopeptide (TPR) repeat protein
MMGSTNLNKSDEIRNQYKYAMFLFNNQQYPEAISLLKKILEKKPNNADILFNLGLAHTRLKDFPSAIKYYHDATNVDSTAFDVWYNMGLAYYYNKNYTEAQKCYETALKLNEDHQVWMNKGLAEEAQKNYDAALKSYEKALQISPQYAKAWSNKGIVFLYLTNQAKEAVDCFKHATENEPNNDNYWFYLGDAYSKLAQFKEAVKCFQQSLRIDPRKKDSYSRIGASYESLGLLNEAKYYFTLAESVEKEKLDFAIAESSPDLLTDLWTFTDNLDYDIYANTIVKLLQNLKQTPVAISIQAPWGAGKTSLMRIIQEKIEINKGIMPEQKKHRLLSFNKLYELKQELEEIVKNEKKNNNSSLHEEQIVTFGIEDPKKSGKKYVTIWFDPWEYENTEQLWAGLAHSIVREIIDRLPSVGRELFLLQLNLRIFNFKDLLRWVKSYILRQVWKKLRPWLFVTIGGLIASGLTTVAAIVAGGPGHPPDPTLSSLGISGFIGTGIQIIVNFLRNEKKIEDITTSFALRDYLNIPDYSAKLGKTHEAMEDIRRIFRAIPHEYKPLVIFIDDLDRCSPNSIANLFEGINQFISTDFQNCIFIIGMDSQVIASSLDLMYKEVIENLPEYLVQSQIGWRYLEKFIQLPILIPPTSEEKFGKYVESLVSTKEHLNDIVDLNPKILKIPSDKNGYQNNTQTKEMETNIKNLSKAAYIFSNNPRDVKRFLNLVTYYINLHSEIKLTNSEIKLPSYEQIRRWIILILKWPSLAQWLYWTQDTLSFSLPSDVLNSTGDKLRLLESIAQESKDQKDWKERISLELNFNEPRTISWIMDNNVREFFRDENNQPDGGKISDGAGLKVY